MARLINLSGKVFGRLTVIRRQGSTFRGQSLWMCRCSCGNLKVVRSYSLGKGDTKSCGCLHSEVCRELLRNKATHGQARQGQKTVEYLAWSSMLSRCTDKKSSSFKNYGGRGIAVCKRWYAFKEFYLDMGKRPDGTTLERIDNSKGYSPENCKWATWKEQGRNRRGNRRLNFDGESLTLAEWSERTGIKFNTLHNRLSRGWSVEEVLFTKVRVCA